MWREREGHYRRRAAQVPREAHDIPLPIGAANAQDPPARRPCLRRAAPRRAGAPASLSGVVVSQVYAGGGNTGASFDHDFVELFNPGAGRRRRQRLERPVRLRRGSGTWQTTILAGQIPAGHYFLVQLNSAASIGAALPAAGRHRDDQPGRLRRQGRPRHRRDRALLRHLCGRLLRRRRPSRTSSATARPATTRARRRSRALSQLDRRRAGRRRAAPTPTRTHDDFSVAAPTPRNSSAPGVDLLGSAPPPHGRLAGRRQSTSTSRPCSRSRSSVRRSASARRSPATRPPPISERVTVVSNNAAGLHARRPPHRVHAGRPAARPREHRSRRRNARRLARRRRAGRDPDRSRSRPGDRHDLGATRGRRRRLADDDRLHRPAARRSRPATTPRPSPTR